MHFYILSKKICLKRISIRMIFIKQMIGRNLLKIELNTFTTIQISYNVQRSFLRICWVDRKNNYYFKASNRPKVNAPFKIRRVEAENRSIVCLLTINARVGSKHFTKCAKGVKIEKLQFKRLNFTTSKSR